MSRVYNDKFGVNFCEKEKGVFTLKGKFIPAKTCIATYKDHRMAMAFAPLLLKIPDLIFENPSVVVKSFPHFWEEVKKMKQCFNVFYIMMCVVGLAMI